MDLSPFGFPARSNNPALEFFLQALPLSYVGSVPSMSDSDRGYRQSVVSGFAPGFLQSKHPSDRECWVKIRFLLQPDRGARAPVGYS
jgi:hypothetical protein